MNCRFGKQLLLLIAGFVHYTQIISQDASLVQKAMSTMVNATRFMSDSVSTQGGYVWYYLPDMSRRWGEMEAYPTQVWVQDGGTVSVGHMLLDAYHATHVEYFYQQAERAADAMIKGQSKEGGWNYLVDFAGEKSLRNWYATIGRNGWRLEEFQHYYGNDTYDDDVTSDAARFLLRMYIEKHDPKYKPALDKAIGFILKRQYPNGGWPQRYPLKDEFHKQGHPDYTSFYTFNDDVIWENVHFLIQCYEVLGEKRFLDPIQRGMNFYYISQNANGAWGQQYNMKLEVAGARTYEPTAFLPVTTFTHCMLLMRFYTYTGDPKYLSGIPAAIKWLEATKFTTEQGKNGRYTHPRLIDVKTNQPMYVHRKGGNVKYGTYYIDDVDTGLLAHMGGKSYVDVQKLKDEYERIKALPAAEVTKDSPLKPGLPHNAMTAQHVSLSRSEDWIRTVSDDGVQRIIGSLDSRNRWLVKHAMTSHPYIGDGTDSSMTHVYASTNVGDMTDTSPFRDMSEQEYISTPAYIRNMEALIAYINSENKKQSH